MPADMTMTFGAPHRHFRVTDSTNARARELVESGAPGGTVVTAVEQTAGRGRQGRSWTALAGQALLYSAIVRPLDERHLLLPLSVPLAVCEAVEELEPGIECAIKWPNDVWVEGRKLAGVLIEAKPQDGWAVIGVGLNLSIAPNEFPPDLRETATSLSSHAGSVQGPMDPQRSTHRTDDARRALDAALDRWVEADREETLAAWRSRDALRGSEVAWDGGAGIANGIEDSGDLVVVAGGDRIVLGAGEIHLRL